jgi:two-component system, OmpR family, sensor kinase
MFRSLYFRIGFSFVIFLVVVIVAQSAIFSYVLARSSSRPSRPPNNVAAIVAADIGATLAQDPTVDLRAYLTREYGDVQPIYVVMKDGRVAGNRAAALDDRQRTMAEAVLGTDGRTRAAAEPPFGGTPTVTAPIQLGHELRGLVVLPPLPQQNPVARDVGRLLSVPGTLLLVVATVLAAAVIFEPARRRLQALESATARFGAGDLTARAPESGRDEIGRVAAAFNRMAGELAIRDEALRTSDRLRRQMLADVSHELKTPLTAMRGYVETLHMADVTLDGPTRERYFATLERETHRLDRIVKDLLDLGRLENGVAPLDARLFDITRVFDHVVARHEHETTARRIAIERNVDDAADQLTADPGRIEQVIENLFANALRHAPDGSTIVLSARAADDRTVLSVVDAGAGIPAEHLPHVFERFYRADSSRAPRSGGTGLGLSIAKAIVERHGGQIDVTSEPGRTAFTIALPASDI